MGAGTTLPKPAPLATQRFGKRVRTESRLPGAEKRVPRAKLIEKFPMLMNFDREIVDTFC